MIMRYIVSRKASIIYLPSSQEYLIVSGIRLLLTCASSYRLNLLNKYREPDSCCCGVLSRLPLAPSQRKTIKQPFKDALQQATLAVKVVKHKLKDRDLFDTP